MNRFYFLTLLFVLLCVGTQVEAAVEKRWRIHNRTGEPVSIEAITEYTRGEDPRPVSGSTKKYDVKEDGFVTFIFDTLSVSEPELSVNNKKVSTPPPKPPKYEDDESGFWVAKFNLFEDASLGYVLHAETVKK